MTVGRWAVRVRRNGGADPGPPRRRPRLRPRWAVLLVLAGLAAGHLAYWYLPRERPAAPLRGDLAERLLSSGEYDLCLWIPYPHQNLGALAEAVDDPAAYLRAAAEAAGLPPPEIPRFGPFAVPPARELVVAGDRSGDRLLVAARVFPLLAGAARLAGRLGSNPWLAGGEATAGGRPVRVEWEGTLWKVETGAPDSAPGASPAAQPEEVGEEPPPESSAAPGLERAPALARLALRRAVGSMPPGEYRLLRAGAGLEVRGEGTPGEATLPALGAAALAFSSEGAGPPGLPSSRALALFLGEGRLGLPSMAALDRGGGERWKLPGEGLLGFLGGELPSGEAAGWRILALDGEAFRRAQALAPGLSTLERRGVRLAVQLDPAAAHRLVGDVAAVLDAVPIVGGRHARRWRLWEYLLEPLASRRELAVVVGAGPGEVGASLR